MSFRARNCSELGGSLVKGEGAQGKKKKNHARSKGPSF